MKAKKAEEKDDAQGLAWHTALYTLMVLFFSLPFAVGAYVFLVHHGFFYGRPFVFCALAYAGVVYFCFLKTLARKSLKWMIGAERYQRLMRLLEDQ